jgi:hypothetical protein
LKLSSLIPYGNCAVERNALCEAHLNERRLLGCYAVSLVRTDISEELSAYIISVTRIGELETTLAAS